MKILILVLAYSFSSTLFAQVFPSTCERSHEQVIDMLKQEDHRLSFFNDGGLFNGGVCWWHSRLERAANYLAVFSPEKVKPSGERLKQILKDLSFLRPVEIPGYKNLFEVSYHNKKIFQETLNQWQVRDGFINQAWIKGLSGTVHMAQDKLQVHMMNIYDTFLREKKPYFLMMQLPAIVAHAFLLLDMKETTEGYTMWVVDSNNPTKVFVQNYKLGSTALTYEGKPFIPYIGFEKDFFKIEKNLSDFCHEI